MRLPWGLRWWELLPEAVLATGLCVFLVVETSAATSAFTSTTAVVLMALVGVAWLAGRLLLVRYCDLPVLRLAVFAAAAVGVLTVVVLPAFDDTTVVETLPVAVAAQPPAPPGVTPTTAARPPAASPTAPAQNVPTTTGAPAPTAAPAPDPTPVPTTPPQPAAGPVELRRSAIHGIDHRASGTAVIYRQADGSILVGLEGIDIQPGPDYDVYVVPGTGREDPDGGTRLDDLRGNKGTQYYAVPGGTDVTEGPWTVLVWCQTFDVPIAGATPV